MLVHYRVTPAFTLPVPLYIPEWILRHCEGQGKVSCPGTQTTRNRKEIQKSNKRLLSLHRVLITFKMYDSLF